MKRKHLLAYLTLLILLILGTPQDTSTKIPDNSDLGGDEPATNLSFSVSNQNSDWFVHYTGTFNEEYCNCTNLQAQHETVILKDQNNNTRLQIGPGPAAAQTDFPLKIGPGQNLNLTYSIRFTGSRSWHGDLQDACSVLATCLGGGVDCGCDFTYTGNVSGTAITAPIRNATDFSASDGADDQSITLTWDKGTDIPDLNHKYRIYIDGSPSFTQVNGNVRSWPHNGLSPGETHSYRITTNYTHPSTGTHESAGVTDDGSTFSVGANASDGNYSNRTLIEWSNLSAVSDEIRVERRPRDSANVAREELAILSGSAKSYNDQEGINGFPYTYFVTPLSDGVPYLTGQDDGYSLGNGTIKGTVKSQFGAGVSGVDIEVKLLTTLPTGGQSLPVGCDSTYCTTTDASGFYEIKNIYYYLEADFRVVPIKMGDSVTHIFTPNEVVRSLDENVNLLSGVNFVDETVFTVNGHVTYPPMVGSDTCGVEGVEILLNGASQGIVTDGDGFWQFAIQDEGVYTFDPEYLHHTILDENSNAVSNVTINGDVFDIDFVDIETDTLIVIAQAGCEAPLGDSVRIRISAEDENCFDKIYTTDASGYLMIPDLPARKYNVEIDSIYTMSSNVSNIMAQIGNKQIEIDLTLRDTNEVITESLVQTITPADTVTLPNSTVIITPAFTTEMLVIDTTRTEIAPLVRFIYRAPLAISIDWEGAGATITNCTNSAGDTIILMESEVSYTLVIRVNESLGNCPIDSGFLKVYDQISGRGDDYVLVPIKEGRAFYQIDASQPVTASNPNFHDHEKYLYIVPQVDLLVPVPESYWVLVTGTKSNPGSFLSRTPEIPMLILHDPPGDNSYSFIDKGTSFKHFTRNEVLVGGDAGGYLDLLLGAKFKTPFSGHGFGTKIQFSAKAGQDNFNRNGIETTITFSENFSTSDAPNFTGEDGDVYIGAAFNNEFSLSQLLTFDMQTCTSKVEVIPAISSEDFATTFVYTEKHIKNSLLPTISFLVESIIGDDPGSMTQEEITEVNNLLADSIAWTNILEQNDLHRSQPAAKFKENISFSAGAAISKTHSIDTFSSVSYEYNRFVSSEFGIGAKIDNEGGIWFESEIGFMGSFRFSSNVDTGNDTTQTETIGYVLADDDIGDFLSVDVLTDTAYNMPAFELKAGTTSCPNEEGSQSRDRVEILIPESELENIPIGEAANFIVNLTNFSDSRETREYHVRAVSTTNPDGAAIRLGGQLINNSPASFFLAHEETFNINLEVKRGPLASNYERIGIMMYPPCEYELWQDNGDLVNVDTAYITVRFQTECSSVSLVKPFDNWLVNQNNNDILHVTFGGYDRFNENLDELVLEFKRAGRGFSDRVTIPKESLIGGFYDVFFDVSNFENGNYSVRAKAVCGNGKGTTYSSELKGTIDRTSLAPYGTPSPSDGFLQAGQKISVTYDKEIQCPLNYMTDITLVREDTQEEIPFTAQCMMDGNEIILLPDAPLTDNPSLNGVLVTATAHLLRDESGNVQKYPVVWSFLVNVKPIFWDPEDVYASAIVGHPAIVQGTLKNNALLSKAFSLDISDDPIIDYPEWLTPLQTRGTVLSNGDYTVDFAVDPELLPGIYQGVVTALVEGNPVSMDVTFEMLARPVNWAFDGNLYDNSMTIVTQFSLLPSDAPLSTDTRDVIAAFVNGEIRGLANIEYVPEIDKYAAFLTVFSNDDGGNNAEEINFRFWKALSGVEYSAVEAVDFQPEGRVGTPGSPLILHPEGILQVIPLNKGWNWISLNLDNPDLSREKVFQSIIYASSLNTVTVKSKSKTAAHSNGSGWNGNLTDLALGKGYLVHLSAHSDTLRVPGTIPTLPVQIDLAELWNWIGFPEQVPRPTDEVLDTIVKADGDLFKSQYAFSTYDAVVGSWLGNLKEFNPGEGYKIFLGNQTTLVYRDPSEYRVYPGLYEFNMNVTAILNLEELEEPNAEDLVVAAFVDGYCQGLADVEYVELLGEYRAMLLVHGSPDLLDAEIEFRVLNEKTGVEYIGNAELVTFSNDRIRGTIMSPYILFDYDKPMTIHDGTQYELANCIPNPLNDIGVIPFTLAEEGPVNMRLYDINGQLIKTLLDADLTAGRHQVEVSLGEIQSGLYFYVLDTPGFKATKKLVKN